jgi:lipopolysaccharide export system protein LptA
MRLSPVLLCLLLVLSVVSIAKGQETLSISAPIQIEADRMETSQEGNTVLFSGHVRANQDDLIIKADAMTVRYSAAESQTTGSTEIPVGGLSQKIEMITAKGNVKILQGDWVATGEAMDFNAEKRIVTLFGNARASQDQNKVSGEKIILYLNEGRSVVERGAVEGDRVKAFIYPGSKEN